MAEVTVHDESLAPTDPVLVEGLPGVGLVGKIATDHLVEVFDMGYYASVDCEELPRLATYEADSTDIRPPVRIYADPDRALLALQSDIPISPSSAPSFTECVTSWLAEAGARPVFLSGLPSEKDTDVPSMWGVATGGAAEWLDGAGISAPNERGLVSGPTGALLSEAGHADLDAAGLVVESSERFPDPEAARVLITKGIGPLADVEVDTSTLVDRAEEIQQAKEELAKRMKEAGADESSQAQAIRMYQ